MSLSLTAPPETIVAELSQVSKTFRVRSVGRRHANLYAVDHVDLPIAAGTTLGLVGESGSGKSTIARLLLRLIAPTSGQIHLEGADITNTEGPELRALRRRMQLIFQDPYSSFDPLASVGESIAEALKVHANLDRFARKDQVGELLQLVGLAPVLSERRPSELSGGQLQRIAIARALAARPALLALDEPVSSLDVSTQAQVINLLRRLQRELGLAYLFISHDLSVVRHISHRIAVMYLGRIVEIGDAETVYRTPRHPYTQALLSAAPRPDISRRDRSERIILEGDIPSPLDPPTGCRFHTRCPHVMPICKIDDPPRTTQVDGTAVACHLYAKNMGAVSLADSGTPVTIPHE